MFLLKIILERRNKMDTISQLLCQILQDELFPSMLSSKEDVSIVTAYEEGKEYKIGIMLYDINDNALSSNMFIDEGNTLRYASKNIELSYLIYLNMTSTFGGSNALLQQRLLTKILQVIYDHPCIEIKPQSVSIFLEKLTIEDKIRIWQSFSKPLQPAIYIKASPVCIPSTRTKEIHRVQTVEHTIQKKEVE